MDCFLPFFHPIDPGNQNFEKMKKALNYIIILEMFAINDSHMMYGFSGVECNRQFFLHFGPFFALLLPNNPKNQNF